MAQMERTADAQNPMETDTMTETITTLNADTDQATAERVFRWWLESLTLFDDDSRLLSILTIWAIVSENLQCVVSLLQYYGKLLPLMTNDKFCQANVVAALASSTQLIEICELLSACRSEGDFLLSLLTGHMEETLTQATRKNDLDILHHLNQRLQVESSTTLLSSPFREAAISNNLIAVILLRMGGAPQPTSLSDEVERGRIGADNWKRKWFSCRTRLGKFNSFSVELKLDKHLKRYREIEEAKQNIE